MVLVLGWFLLRIQLVKKNSNLIDGSFQVRHFLKLHAGCPDLENYLCTDRPFFLRLDTINIYPTFAIIWLDTSRDMPLSLCGAVQKQAKDVVELNFPDSVFF